MKKAFSLADVPATTLNHLLVLTFAKCTLYQKFPAFVIFTVASYCWCFVFTIEATCSLNSYSDTSQLCEISLYGPVKLSIIMIMSQATEKELAPCFKVMTLRTASTYVHINNNKKLLL